MSTEHQLKLDIIDKMDKGEIDKVNASKILQKSRRTIERYLKDYRDKGDTFIFHKNRNRTPVNKISDDMRKNVQSLILSEYFDFNLTHLKEKLEEDKRIFVKRETLRKWAYEIHHVKRGKKRRRKVRKRRERMQSCGLMIQMDGSLHKWFGNKKSCLIIAIDDANSEIHGEFFKSETTIGCMKVLKNLIKKKGVFKMLYVDRAGIFGGHKRQQFSQLMRACKELGIQILFAHSPQGKGRVERAFNTLQDRLIPDLRQNKITTMPEANRFLHQKFIPSFWEKRMMVEPKNVASEYTSTLKPLDSIFVQKEYRKVRLDHTFSYKNTFYLIENVKESIAGYQIEVRIEEGNVFSAYFRGEKLKISEVIQPKKRCLNQNDKFLNQSTCPEEKYHKNRTPKDIEEKIVCFCLQNPHFGNIEVSKYFKQSEGIIVYPSTIRNIWLRHKIQTKTLRQEKAIQKQKVA